MKHKRGVSSHIQIKMPRLRNELKPSAQLFSRLTSEYEGNSFYSLTSLARKGGATLLHDRHHEVSSSIKSTEANEILSHMKYYEDDKQLCQI